MSLDISLEVEHIVDTESRDMIMIRESGSMKEITRDEWNRRFPDRSPVMIRNEPSREVYSTNITHNLGGMASAAGSAAS